MALITEVDLPYLPIDDPGFQSDPFPYIDAARAQHPWLARIDVGYFVFGYEAVKLLAARDDWFHPDFQTVVDQLGLGGTPWADYQTNMLVGISGDRHRRIRMSTGAAFTPVNINRHLGLIREQAAAMLDQWAPKGRFDFVEFAASYPISVMCRLLDAATDEIPRLKAAFEAQSRIGSRDPALIPTLLEGFHLMWDFSDRLIRAHEVRGLDPDNMLDQFIMAKNEGKLDEKELRYLLMILFPAGYDTSKNALSLIMHYMIDRPGDWRRCAEDLPYCRRVTEEMFRFHSTVSQKRTVVEEFEHDGIRFPVGTFVAFGTNIVGRDPRAFEDADVFNPDLPRENRNFAFGRGAHLCLGRHLARAQIAEGIHLIAQQVKNPRRTGEVAWRKFLGIGGLETLPIEFDLAPATN